MILDATTVQLCPRYPRGSAMDDADLFYLSLFHAFRYMNVVSRSFKTTRAILLEYLKMHKVNSYTAVKITDDVQYVLELSYVANKTNRVLSGVIETVSVNGVIYNVPIFALSKTSSLSLDGRPKFGVLIYDDTIYSKADERVIKNTFLYNITLMMLREKSITVDFVEYIFKSEGYGDFKREVPGHRRVVISNPTYDMNLITSYNNIFKKNLPNMYLCGSCKYKTHCWGETNVKNYKH